VIHTLHEQAAFLGWDLRDLLSGSLKQAAPQFIRLVATQLSIKL